MIYTFRSPQLLKDGTIIKKGDSVFIDDPDAVNEITEIVNAALAKEEVAAKKKIKDTK